MPFRCISRSLRRLLPSLRVGLCGCAILYAGLRFYAEAEYAYGMDAPTHQKAIAKLTLARSLFPLDYKLRLGLADYYMMARWVGSRPAAEKAIYQALNDDPYAMGLYRDLAGLYIEDGNKQAALEQMLVLRAFLPSFPVPIWINSNPLTGGVSALPQ